MMYDRKLYMTRLEKKRYEKRKIIIKDFVNRAIDIINGDTTFNRVRNFLAEKYDCSPYGVERILRDCGIYHGASKQLTLPEESEIMEESEMEVLPAPGTSVTDYCLL